jgi:hypothetical protein
MRVFVEETGIYYRLVSLPSTWGELSVGGGGGEFTARNNTGLAIPKGTAVRVTGAVGHNPTIAPARADSYATAEAVGVTKTDIANNSTGTVVEVGEVQNLNLSDFSDGQTVYLSATTAGALTSNEPTKPNWQVQVGYILRAHPTQGKLLVFLRVETTKTEYISDMTATGTALATASDQAAGRTALGLGTAATRDVPSSGNASSTQAVLGSDTRLTDRRAPLDHAATHGMLGVDPISPLDIGAANAVHGHGNITPGGLLGTTSGVPLITAGGGLISAGSFGTTAGTFAQGNDARFDLQTITLTGDVTGSGTGSFAATIANDAVTFAKLQNLATDSLVGRDTAGSGDAESITVGGGIEFTGASALRTSAFTGDVTKTAGGTSLTIANDAVTYAKMQNVTATDRLLGRSTAGAGDVEEIVCTAYARGLLDDADAATARTTLGLGTTDTPKFARVSFANDEYIENPVDGRMDFRPSGNSANHFGIYFDFTSFTVGARVGVLRQDDGTKNPAGSYVQFETQLAIVSDTNTVYGNNAECVMRVTTTGNDTFQIAPSVAAGRSAAVAICNQVDVGVANRSPATAHVDPTFYVYSSDGTQANDFVRVSHNQTNGVIESGNGHLNLVSAGDINNNGNRIPKVFSGTTAPGAFGDEGDLYFQY